MVTPAHKAGLVMADADALMRATPNADQWTVSVPFSDPDYHFHVVSYICEALQNRPYGIYYSHKGDKAAIVFYRTPTHTHYHPDEFNTASL